MIKSSKTPFEIRTDLLALARSILYDRYLHSKDGDPDAQPPSTEQVIDEAAKLNTFVCQRE